MSGDQETVCGLLGTPQWLTERQFQRIVEFHGFSPEDEQTADAKARCWNPQRQAYSASKLNDELGY